MATPFQSKRLQSAEKSADPSHDYGELESLPEDLRPEKRGGIWSTGGELENRQRMLLVNCFLVVAASKM